MDKEHLLKLNTAIKDTTIEIYKLKKEKDHLFEQMELARARITRDVYEDSEKEEFKKELSNEKKKDLEISKRLKFDEKYFKPKDLLSAKDEEIALKEIKYKYQRRNLEIELAYLQSKV
jgi:hypothetical protein